VDREILVQEYRTIVSHSYPYINSLLNDCYLKILDGCVTSISNSYSYLGIYYAGIKAKEIILYEKELKKIAQNLGIIEVVVINAKRIIRDPMSCLKKENPRLWLELYWISSKVETNLD
jgi:glyoxylate carboligase